jgi:hypothetical protein
VALGELCDGRDTKVNRDVAIKTLPEAFAANPDRFARAEPQSTGFAELSQQLRFIDLC